MQTFFLIILICFLVSPLPANQVSMPEPQSDSSNSDLKGFNQMEIDILQRLLKAKPEKLRVLRKTIERVELMTVDERKAMSERLHAFRNSTTEEKKMLMMRLKNRSKAFSQLLKKLPPEKRRKEMEYFRSLNETQRGDYLKKAKAEQAFLKE
jgi:predicted CopG family antitoxin